MEQTRLFPCYQCGHDMVFAIDAKKLNCKSCGATTDIAGLKERKNRTHENDLVQKLKERASKQAAPQPAQGTHCQACGAHIVFTSGTISTHCQFCGSPVQTKPAEAWPVDGLLPFHIPKKAAEEKLQAWIKSRWFAPQAFKQHHVTERFTGLYAPFWTFDAMTSTYYEGERGDRYQTKNHKGESETRVKWSYRDGEFSHFFDDVLVCAGLKDCEHLMDSLAPWPLKQLVPYHQEVLAGFSAMTFEIPLEKGFQTAKQKMHEHLKDMVSDKIGGDEQRIHHLDIAYEGLKYKQILLPVWILAYRYRQKSYQVVVNACTGEVSGERPYSITKIILAVIVTSIAALSALRYIDSSEKASQRRIESSP